MPQEGEKHFSDEYGPEDEKHLAEQINTQEKLEEELEPYVRAELEKQGLSGEELENRVAEETEKQAKKRLGID